ncbi:MAG TPA: hypothetical protein VG711_12855 [Phycisphaerales bacterium]|nr:hypothetical protein [Phycisphaerales bacterium]
MLTVRISKADLDRWAVFLNLSDDQIAAIAQSYVGYSSSSDAFDNEERAAINQQAIIAANPTGKVQDDLSQRTQFFSMIQDAKRHQATIDRQFIDSVVTLLGKSQADEKDVLYLDRDRAVCGAVFFPASMLPRARCDLSQLVFDLNPDKTSLNSIKPIVLEYWKELVPVLTQASREILKCMPEDAVIMSKMAQIDRSDMKQALTLEINLTEERRKLWAQTNRMRSRVVEINKKYYPQIEKALSSACAERFEKSFAEKAYPTLYPDLPLSKSWIPNILAMEDLDKNQREAIQSIASSYDSEYRNICAKLEGQVDEWFETQMEQRAITNEYRDAYESNVADLKAERMRLLTRTAKKIGEVLTSSQLDRLPKGHSSDAAVPSTQTDQSE